MMAALVRRACASSNWKTPPLEYPVDTTIDVLMQSRLSTAARMRSACGAREGERVRV